MVICRHADINKSNKPLVCGMTVAFSINYVLSDLLVTSFGIKWCELFTGYIRGLIDALFVCNSYDKEESNQRGNEG